MLDYTLPHDDPLGVLSSTRFVMERAESVRLDPEALARIADELGPLMTAAPDWHDARHFADGTWRTAGWVLVLDALNFCFWSQTAERWLVQWEGRLEDGYWALAAALTRATEEMRPIWDPAYCSRSAHGMSPTSCGHMTRMRRRSRFSRSGSRTCMSSAAVFSRDSRRPAHPVQALIEGADGSAVELVRSVVERFPSFNDIAMYQEQEVRFYKRAQILVSDLAGAFNGRGLGTFHDLNLLTAFADYKIPQVLRGFNALIYSPELDAAIAERRLIPMGSAWEVEIRAATIWACEFLRRDPGRAGPVVPGDRDRLDPLARRPIPARQHAAVPPHIDGLLLGEQASSCRAACHLPAAPTVVCACPGPAGQNPIPKTKDERPETYS